MPKDPNINFRTSEGLQREFKAKLAREGKTIGDILEPYVKAWIEGAVAGAEEALKVAEEKAAVDQEFRKVFTPSYAPANREYHDKLEAILNSGDEKTINAVIPNIEVFYERLKPAKRKKASGE